MLKVQEEEHKIVMEDVAAVQEYQKQQRDRDRMSLASRLAAAKREHELDLIEHRKKLESIHQDIESIREGWLDVQVYKESEKEKRRKSICFRLDSWRQQKMIQEKENSRLRMIAEEDAKFRQMDHQDIQAAKKREQEELKLHFQQGRFQL